MKGRALRHIAIGGVAVLALVAGAGNRAQAAATAAPITFGVPVPSGIIGDGFEEDLQLDTTSAGHEIVYSASPVASTSGVSVIYRSLDGGQTFKEVPAEVSPTGKPTTCAGGGDAELNVDSAGHLYFADLQNLTNFSVDRSDDHGMTFDAPSCTGVPDAGVDRQWYTSIGDPTNGGALLLTYDRVDQDNAANGCPVSDIGNMLVMARSPALSEAASTAGEIFGPSLVLSCNEGIMGNDVSYTYSDTGPRVFVVHDSNDLHNIYVDRCDVGTESATDPTGLVNCTGDITVASFPNALTGANFPTIAVDRQGGLFTVWEEAPDSGGSVTGNTQLYWSYSIDEGTTWSAPEQLPTPGSLQDVMAWGGAGDQGRVDVAYYGAPEPWASGDTAGPDSINGHYGLYMTQTLNAVTCSPTCSVNTNATWSTPVLASEHFTHYGSMYTLIGGQSGNRGVGDFFQLRIGPDGEAEISFADTNNFEGNLDLDPEAMYVRQITGPSVFGNVSGINGVPRSTDNCENDTATEDATFDSDGTVGADQPNLDLLTACMSQPDASHDQVTMKVADLTTLAPENPASLPGGTTFIWQTQWHMPSSADTTNGGALFMVYMESEDGATPTCWLGQSSQQTIPGYELTYPGSIQLTGSACTYTPTSPGTITITFPISDLSTIEPYPFDSSTLYSVTASTQTLPAGNAETPPATPPAPEVGVVQGQLPNLIDVLPPFDFTAQPTTSTPESPLTPLLLVSGSAVVLVAATGIRRRRRTRLTA